MRVSSDYEASLKALSSFKASSHIFKGAGQMNYANQIKVQKKAEALIETLIKHLRFKDPNPKLFFKRGETVHIPDIHGDFVHLIKTLHRHGLLSKNLNLKKEYRYVFLGDFYDRGRVADVTDFWLNKQITRGVNIHRLAGNHEMTFIARDKDGSSFFTPAQDSEKDRSNGFQVTEDILKNISEGEILAIFVSPEENYGIPISSSHSFLIKRDFEAVERDEADIFGAAVALNERFRELGEDSYERFLDCKERDKYNWREINEPFFNDPLFNIQSKVKGTYTSFLMRRPLKWGKTNEIARRLIEQIPKGVYQVVGHTTTKTFPLPKDVPSDRPLIVGNQDSSGYVQFSDVAIGFSYRKKLKRPDVIFKKEFAEQI